MGGISISQLVITLIVLAIFILPKLFSSLTKKSPAHKKQTQVVLLAFFAVYLLFNFLGS